MTVSTLQHKPWPKTRRVENILTVATEKIDGTNAAVHVAPHPESDSLINNPEPAYCTVVAVERAVGDGIQTHRYLVAAQSRNRLLSPFKGGDNYGFGRWVADNATVLATVLGAGIHYGEWWGAGIQRGYGIDRKLFSLFNTARWHRTLPHTADGLPTPNRDDVPDHLWLSEIDHAITAGLRVVPTVLTEPGFPSGDIVERAWNLLASGGSYAAPGWGRPEGVIVTIPEIGCHVKHVADKQG